MSGRALLAAGVAVTATLASTLPAAAHGTLVSADPADGATVARAPAQVVLTFAEPVLALGTAVVVTGPGGEVQTGPPQLAGRTVRQPLRSGAPAGTYRVTWRATVEDGHPVSGRFGFTASAAAASESPVAPLDSEAPSTESHTAVWVAGLAALGIGGSAVAVSRRRRSRTSSTQH